VGLRIKLKSDPICFRRQPHKSQLKRQQKSGSLTNRASPTFIHDSFLSSGKDRHRQLRLSVSGFPGY
jgi:hypothetical protein